MPDVDQLITTLQVIGTEAATVLRTAPTGTKDETQMLRKLSMRLISEVPAYQEAVLSVMDLATHSDVEMTETWLSAWFSLQTTDESFLHYSGIPWVPRFTVSPRVSITHALAFCEHLVNHMVYVLSYYVAADDPTSTPVPSTPSFKLADESQLFLLCEWSHYQGVPRAVPLADWIRMMYQPEIALYSVTNKGAYRQHMFHVQDVCILGLVLLDASIRGQRLVDKLRLDDTTQSTTSLWCLCALLHDIGQLLEILPTSAKYVREAESRPLQWLGARATDAVEDLGRQLNEDFSVDPTCSRNAAALPPTHHARIGAAMLFSRLGRTDDGLQCLDETLGAVAAILEHDATKGSVDARVDPLAALLILCDQLQEFGRTRIEASELAAHIVSYLHRAAETASIPMRRLSSPAALHAQSVLVAGGHLDFERRIRFRVDLGQTAGTVVEPRVVWLDACRRLQRLEFFPNTWIDYTNSYNSSQQPSELDRLLRFAEAQSAEYGSLAEWGRLAAKSVDGLRHSIGSDPAVDDPEARTEMLSLRLPELAARRPLSCDVSATYRRMVAFENQGS